ncbi:MAG: type II toxin-antitoxin system RelE/ParE family toxin, partial [Chlorobiaceae bacterium]|nr:type II toxin-antitoxin system RelE/ParE family toxin [Chlorobiaceae bacterium]
MGYEIGYFHPRIMEDILRWPVSIRADYARIIELLMEFGPDLRMPHSKALGNGLFELRARGKDGIGRSFY